MKTLPDAAGLPGAGSGAARPSKFAPAADDAPLAPTIKLRAPGLYVPRAAVRSRPFVLTEPVPAIYSTNPNE